MSNLIDCAASGLLALVFIACMGVVGVVYACGWAVWKVRTRHHPE